MKTTEKVMSIEDRLKSREFRNRLQEHPIVKAKVQRAKQELGIDDTRQPQHSEESAK